VQLDLVSKFNNKSTILILSQNYLEQNC